MKIIGIKENKGKFNEKDYLNYQVYLQLDNGINDLGTCVMTVKVKPDILEEIKKYRGVSQTSELIGLDVKQVYYDSFKNVVNLVG